MTLFWPECTHCHGQDMLSLWQNYMKTKTEIYVLSKEPALGIWMILHNFWKTALPDSITPSHWENILSPIKCWAYWQCFSLHCFPRPYDEKWTFLQICLFDHNPVYTSSHSIWLYVSLISPTKCWTPYFYSNLRNFISKSFKERGLEGLLTLPAPVTIFSHMKILLSL